MASANDLPENLMAEMTVQQSWPEYHCSKHGTVQETLVFTLDEEKYTYCIRCWREFLAQHLQKVERIKK